MPIDITDVSRRVQYTGSGTGPYNFTFQILDDDDVAVYRNDTLLTKVTDYSVTINGDGTGSITTVASMTGFTVTILGARPYARLTDFSTGGDFFAANVNDELDSILILIQQLRATINLSAKLAQTTTFSGNLIVPDPVANLLLGWNSTATSLENKALADLSLTTVSAFMATLLDDSTAGNARTTLGAAADAEVVKLTGNQTVAGVKTFSDKPVLPVTTPTGNEAASAAAVASAVGPGVKQGLTLSNNVTDATNDVDVAAGKAVDTTSAVVMNLPSTTTKRLDANWAPGTGNGGRYSGAALANTSYHGWLVTKANGVDPDIYFAPSAVAATVLGWLQAEPGGSAYAHLWRIGAILRESGVIVPFVQNRAEFLRKATVLDVNITNSTTAAVTTTLSVPTGIKVAALMNVAADGDGVGNVGAVYLSSLDANDEAPSATAAPLATAAAFNTSTGDVYAQAAVKTNTSAQIRRRTFTATGSFTRIATLGWVDDLIYGA
jgi:hypothetical protein